jgi:hypothetical protein
LQREIVEGQPYCHILPGLNLLDALAHLLEHLARLLDQLVHPLPHPRRVPPRAQVPDLAVQPLVIAVEPEQLVHQVLRETLELGIVGVAGRAAATPRLERRELVE